MSMLLYGRSHVVPWRLLLTWYWCDGLERHFEISRCKALVQTIGSICAADTGHEIRLQQDGSNEDGDANHTHDAVNGVAMLQFSAVRGGWCAVWVSAARV